MKVKTAIKRELLNLVASRLDYLDQEREGSYPLDLQRYKQRYNQKSIKLNKYTLKTSMYKNVVDELTASIIEILENEHT